MLSKLRPRITYANVMSTVCVFVVLGGTSYAVATGSIDSREIKNNSIRSKDVRNNGIVSRDVRDRSLRAVDFGLGQLPSGQRGATGATGPTGSPAASAFTSRWRNGSIGGSYGPVTGIGLGTAPEDDVQQLSPAVPIVARDLVGRYDDSNDFPSGGTRTFILRVNGADTTLRCTLTRPQQSCSNTTARVTIPPGSLLAIRFDQGGSDVGAGEVVVGLRATTP